MLILQFSSNVVRFESSAEEESLIVTSNLDEIALTDVIENPNLTPAQETIAVGGGSFSSDSVNLARQANDGDEPYIDVDFFIPPLQPLF